MTDKNLNLLLSNINLCIAKTEGAEKEQFKEYKKIVENFQSRKQYQDGSEAFVAGNKSQQQNKEEQQIKSIYSAVSVFKKWFYRVFITNRNTNGCFIYKI